MAEKISDYIGSRIRGKSFSNREQRIYIEELMRMESFIRNPPGGMLLNVQFASLKMRYQKEYLAILKELDMKEYEREKERLFEEKKRRLELEKGARKRGIEAEKGRKKLWLRLGGVE